MPFNSRELLARMIKCEAGGEGENGMRAVATVIMNRVHVAEGEYMRVNMGNLRDVLFQQYQFDCARTTLYGMYNPQNIFDINPEPIHFEIADWALAGGQFNGVANSLWYYNPFGSCSDFFPNQNGQFHNRINLHCFYTPTASYAET